MMNIIVRTVKFIVAFSVFIGLSLYCFPMDANASISIEIVMPGDTKTEGEVPIILPYGEFDFNRETNSIVGYRGSGGIVTIPNPVHYNCADYIKKYVWEGGSWNEVSSDCDQLYYVYIEKFDDWVFANADITGVVLPSLNEIGASAFRNNSIAGVLNIPQSVQRIGANAFRYNEITELKLEYSSNPCYIDNYAFADNKLVKADLPFGTFVGEYGLYNNALTQIEIPSNCILEYGALQNNALTRIQLGSNVRLGGNLLSGNNSLQEAYKLGGPGVYIGTQNGSWYKDISEYLSIGETTGIIYGYSNVNGPNIVIPSMVNGIQVKGISPNTFAYCNLSGVVLPNTLEYIGDGAFKNNLLMSIDIPNGVTSIGSFVFANNILGRVKISDTVLSIGASAFVNNTYLNNVQFGSGLTTIGDNAFANNKLSEIVISDNVTSIGEKAFTKNNMTSLQLGSKVYYIGKNAFAENRLTSVTIPSSVRTIDAGAFSSNFIRTVSLPEDMNTIGDYAFAYNTDLEEAFLPKYLNTLGNYAFYNCFYMNTIKIGFDVSIGDNLLDTANSFRTAYLAEGEGVYKKNASGAWVKGIIDSSYFDFDSTTGTITGYNNAAGYEVIIPSSINGVAVTKIGDNAFKYKLLSKVFIPLGVTSIGSNAFYGNNLTYISIPDSVTNMGSGVFGANNLVSIDLGKGLTTLPGDAFAYNELTSFTVPGTIKEIGFNAFGSNKLTELILQQGVQRIHVWAFSDNNLSKITIGSDVTIDTVVLDDLSQFATAYSLGGEGLYTGTQNGEWTRNTDEKHFNFYNGTIYGYATDGGTDVVIPEKIRGVNVTAIGHSAFAGKGLTSIKMSDTVTTIGDSAFANNRLTSLYLSSALTAMGKSAFANNSLTSITIPQNLTSISDNAFINNQLTSVTIAATVERIGDYAFRNNLITSVQLNEGLKTIGIYAFESNKISNLVIPNGVTDIEALAFSNNQIQSVVIPNTLTQLKHSIFRNNLLTGVTIPDSIITIDYFAFAENQLNNVTIPDSVGTVKYGAFSYNQLEQLTLGSNVVIIEDYAFFDNKLTAVILPASLQSIGEYAFADNSLAAVSIPDSVNDIGSYAFASNKLTSVTIPNNIIAIRSHVFENNLIESVSIPAHINTIGDYAFAYNALVSLTIPSTVTYIGNSAFKGNRLTMIVMEGFTGIGDYMLFEGNNYFAQAYSGTSYSYYYSSNGNPGIYVGTQYGKWEKLVQISENSVSEWEGETLKIILKYTGNLMDDVSNVTKNQFALAFTTGGPGTVAPDMIEKIAENQLILTFLNYPDISVAGGTRSLTYTLTSTIEEVPLRSLIGYYVKKTDSVGVSIASNDQTALPSITEPIKGDDTEIRGTAATDATVILSVNGFLYPGVTATGGNWLVSGLALAEGAVISVTAQAPERTVSIPATATVKADRSQDANLDPASKIKDSVLGSLGTPKNLIELTEGYYYDTAPEWAGYVSLRPSVAADVTSFFETSFQAVDPEATVRVIKFPFYGMDFNNVDEIFRLTTISYNNEAIEPTDCFVVRVTAEKGNVQYYRIHVRMLPEVSATHVFIDQENFNMPIGLQFQLNAAVEPSNATLQEITWSISDSSILSVSESGLVTGISSGTATIKAETPEGVFDTVDITVTNPMIMFDWGINGTLTVAVDGMLVNSGNLVPVGKDIVFSANPDEGYLIKIWTVNDIHNHIQDEYYLDRTLTLTNFQQSTNVLVEFKAVQDFFTFDESTGTITEYDDHGGVDVVIPSTINGVKVKHIGASAFHGKRLNSVELPSALLSIGDFAFMDNYLQSIVIPDGVTDIGVKAFDYNELTDVTFPMSLQNISGFAFSSNKLTSLNLNEGLVNIGEKVFQNNLITTVNIPQSLRSIGSYAFKDNQIAHITIPNSLQSLGESAFSNNKLTSLIIESGLTIIGSNTFANNLLTAVTIPDSVLTVGVGAFKNNKLTAVNLGSNLINILENAFGSNLLSSVTIPANVTSIGVQAFAGMTEDKIQLGTGYNDYFVYLDTERKALKGHIGKPNAELVIPYGVTSIESSAFFNFDLVSVTLSDSVASLSFNAFSNNSINQLQLGKGLKIIGDQAFAQNQLTTVTIPKGVTTVGRWAFANNLLTSITIDSGVAFAGNITNNIINASDQFNSAYNNGGAGTYTGIQYGDWSAVSHKVTISGEGQGSIEPEVGVYDYTFGEGVSLTATPSEGWSFEKWTINGVDNTASTINITINKETTAKAYFKVPSSNVAGTVTETPKIETAVSKTTATATTTITATVDSSGKTTASVTQAQVSGIVNKAGEEAANHGNGVVAVVEIKVEAPVDMKTVEIVLPKTAVDIVADSNITAFTVSTPIATITFDSKTLDTIAGVAVADVKISVSKFDTETLNQGTKQVVGDRPVYNFRVISGDKIISQFNGNVSVSLPYTPKMDEDLNAIVIYYINAEGKTEVVSNGAYNPATGTIRFTTSHFSRYAIGYNKVSFTDVAADAWYSKAVTFIAARNINTGTDNGNYSPEAKITRSEFLVMMMRAYDIAPDEKPKNNFNDAGNTYYTGFLAAAKRLGITAGIGNNLYAPDKEITRQEMFALLYNGLKVINRLPQGDTGKPLSAFSDAGQIAVWAKDAMTSLTKTGTISGSGGKLAPEDTTTRAQIAQMLYNIL